MARVVELPLPFSKDAMSRFEVPLALQDFRRSKSAGDPSLLISSLWAKMIPVLVAYEESVVPELFLFFI